MSNQNKEQEYREIFLAEAMEQHAEIDRLLTVLEKNAKDEQAIQSLFRITHTLKGNAKGMGFQKIAEVAHVLEDFFGEIRDGRIDLNKEVFSTVFRASDVLEQLINAINDQKTVRYRGIKTKLQLLIKTSGGQQSAPSESEVADEEKAETAPEENSPQAEHTATIEEEEEQEEPQEEKEMKDASPAELDKVAFSDMVQVSVKKLDNLLDLVGELLIERDRIISKSGTVFASNEFSRLSRISSDLQYSVMDVRLVQIGFLFNKFHRIVRDAAQVEGKNIQLILEGTETEIDRNILQVMSNSLIHLIRNSVAHGIESGEERTHLGKPGEGIITLSASSESDMVTIKIKDDGRGIDPNKVKKKAVEKGLITANDARIMNDKDAIMLIFDPGFSTSESVTAISGRGVGMDVVKTTLDAIGGSVQVDTLLGEGTTITLKLPASMAVKSTLLFQLQQQAYAIPLSYTESVISIYKSDIHKAANGFVALHQDRTIHIIFLSWLFGKNRSESQYNGWEAIHSEQKLEVVVVNFNEKRIGFVVDKLLQQKEIVEKPLRKPYDGNTFLSGVTIMGNGNVCLVLNIPGIYNSIVNNSLQKTIKT